MSRRFARCCFAAAIVAGCLWTGSVHSQDAEAPAADEIDVLVTFKTHPRHADHENVKKHHGKLKHSYWIVPSVSASVPKSELAALKKEKNVKSVEEDIKIQAHDAELDNAWGVKKIGSEIAHLGGYTGAGVKVAVIDTGIDYTHPDLDANYRGGWDFVNNDADPMDDNGHGTHCAGTIAAEDNGVGVVGVAPNAELYALKVMNASGSGSFSSIIAAVQWCIQNGINVTNNSYGSSSNPGSTVQQAFDNANALGLVMVASAGNSGTSDGTGDNVGYPAKFASVIAVGSTTSGDVRSSFSSTGPNVELAAPGSSIASTKVGGGYVSYSGTSMACPHVVGAAAVLMGGGLSNDDLRYLLAVSSVDLGVSGVDPWYGFGRIDLSAAIAALESPPPPPEPDPTPDPDPTPEPPPAPGIASVDWIAYTVFGGRRNNQNLAIEIGITDEDGLPVPDADVSIEITIAGKKRPKVLNALAITDGDGVATFIFNKAAAGTYVTVVTDVVADGYIWDKITPPNSFRK